jgi:hypothetical protein
MIVLVSRINCAVARAASRRSPTAAAGYEPVSNHVGFVVASFLRILRFTANHSFD